MKPTVSGCIKDVPPRNRLALHANSKVALHCMRTLIFLSKVFIKVGHIQPSFWPKIHTGPFIRGSHTRWTHCEWLGSSARGSVVRRECSREEPGRLRKMWQNSTFYNPMERGEGMKTKSQHKQKQKEKKKEEIFNCVCFLFICNSHWSLIQVSSSYSSQFNSLSIYLFKLFWILRLKLLIVSC